MNILLENNCKLTQPTQATHQGGNTLDFAVMSDNFPRCVIQEVDVLVTVSDHYPVHLEIQHAPLPTTDHTGFHSMKWYRNYRNIDHDLFSSDLSSTLRPLRTSNDVQFPNYLADFNNQT